MKLRQRLENLIAEMQHAAEGLREEFLLQPEALKTLHRAMSTVIETYADRIQAELDYEQPPYIEQTVTKTTREFNPNFGLDRICKCGHTYDRHFDSYENMRPVGCKYCDCWTFEEANDADK